MISIAELTQAAPKESDDHFAPKPVWQRAIYPPRISLNGMLVGCLFAIAIVLSGFMVISLPSPLNGWSQLPKNITYTAQLPLMLMVAAVLGPFMGPATLLIFLIAGLAMFPLFANGGGWSYVFEPGFGYLLGALFAGFWLSRTFHKPLQKNDGRSRSLKLLKKTLVATMVMHITGLLALVSLSILGRLAWGELGGWMFYLSIEKIPYDLLATLILLCLVRQIRLALWLVLY